MGDDDKALLDGDTLKKIISEDSFLNGRVSVVALNELPQQLVTARPYGFILNSDPKPLPGQHWMAFYLPSSPHEPLEFFDSYGLALFQFTTNKYIANFISHNKSPNYGHLRINTATLQGMDSKVCGEYSVLYLRERFRSRNMADIIEYIIGDCEHPDCVVYKTVDSLYSDIIPKPIRRNLYPCGPNKCPPQTCQTQRQFRCCIPRP